MHASRFISRINEPGWTSLMLAVLFIGGIQLIGIGINRGVHQPHGSHVRKEAFIYCGMKRICVKKYGPQIQVTRKFGTLNIEY